MPMRRGGFGRRQRRDLAGVIVAIGQQNDDPAFGAFVSKPVCCGRQGRSDGGAIFDEAGTDRGLVAHSANAKAGEVFD